MKNGKKRFLAWMLRMSTPTQPPPVVPTQPMPTAQPAPVTQPTPTRQSIPIFGPIFTTPQPHVGHPHGYSGQPMASAAAYRESDYVGFVERLNPPLRKIAISFLHRLRRANGLDTTNESFVFENIREWYYERSEDPAETPIPDTKLFVAPFFNTSSGGVCLGTSTLKRPTVPTYGTIIAWWEDRFWLSKFSHASGNSTTNGIVAATLAAADSPFDEKQLLASGNKLKDLF